jgi:alkanesulfonate monooxygenase SsuD/methylene tetrahydromethanopterin reductase-like flavin-dependent oxidoreductase (luciferase family)
VTAIGVMIEGQEGLTWERWRSICRDADQLGFATLRRSDHLFSVMHRGDHFVSLMPEHERDCIDCWTSLALAAEWTSRIEFGPMVTPLTFKLPALLAREAAAVDVLAGGRLILGVGAGWNALEHEAFGIPFPSLKERFDNLESGIDRIHRTWEISNPKPPRGGQVPLLIGGGGEKRTLGLAARHAAEWNLNPLNLDAFRSKSAILDGYCRDLGRDPSEIRRSVMCVALVGRDRDELRQRARALGQVIPRFKEMEPDQVVAAVAESGLAGTADHVAERVREVSAAGVQLLCLQHFLFDDPDHLRVLADVAKAVA